MMNAAFDDILKADAETRAGLFAETAQRLGTTPQNAEKDFWVCWTLDLLFNGLADGGPRLLFKGGTSLSKGYGLISRFSEDIDVTVFREDLGNTVSAEALRAMTNKPRNAALDDIKAKCTAYLQRDLLPQLTEAVGAAAERCNLAPEQFRVEADPNDEQTLLLVYPKATAQDDYVRPHVKIESGAKSALDPHAARTLRPYVDDDLPEMDLSVQNVITVDPQRTFWDKVVILHGLRSWFDRRGELRGDGQRVSRHYYDIYRLLNAEVGTQAAGNRELGEDCVAHAALFFNRPDYDLAAARPGSFRLSPHDGMIVALKRDYAAMSGMIFGEVPDFDVILAAVADLEARLNAVQPETAFETSD